MQNHGDLKRLIRIMPVLPTIIFMGASFGTLNGLTILYALINDRYLEPRFKNPTSSFLVFNLFSSKLPNLDREPLRSTYAGGLSQRVLTPFQRVGTWHVIKILAMVVSALIERRQRLHVV